VSIAVEGKPDFFFPGIPPRHKPLRVELDVEREEFEYPTLGERPSLPHALFEHQFPNPFLQAPESFLSGAGAALRERGMRAHEAFQIVGKTGHVAHPTIMRQVESLGGECAHAPERTEKRLGIELRRAGGRENRLSPLHVELPVGKPEAVAGEKMPGVAVLDEDVVARMARGVEKAKLPPGEAEPGALPDLDDSLGRYRNDVAVDAAHRLLAVDRRRRSHEARRIGHMARAARVHREAGARKLRHQRPRPAGVVEMHVRQDDVLHVCRRDAERGERSEHARCGARGAGVHDRRASPLQEEVHRRLQRPVVDRVHREDSVSVIDHARRLHSRIIESAPRGIPAMNIAELRQEYMRAGLHEADAHPDALVQFQRWMHDALASGLPLANAMILATVSETGAPDARALLLKGVEDGAFLFYTNYRSRKGRQLEARPEACLVFLWLPLERQVRVEGTVERLSAAESDAYFATRPLGARRSAWASAQSETVAGREVLETAMREIAARFGEDPPRPPHWGGYRLVPRRLEFWQGRENRLHDRLLYTRAGDRWTIERLAP